MGGTMKAAHGHHDNRRRWSSSFAVMAILCGVFGCGILGIIGIHRFRERSSLNLLIKEKDDQIISLHLLLQKERARVAEAKRKTEEMRMEAASLGSREAELSGKVSEMRSTISSLREEQRAVESALQEKQNQSPRVEALKEELKQKQGEIEGLRLRLNATMAEATENGGAADADRVREDSAKSEKGEEVMKASDDQEPEGTRRFRGRLVGKRTQVRRSDGNGLRNSSGGKPHASREEPAKMEDVRAQENEQMGDESHEMTNDKNEHRVAERNGQEHDGRDAEESEDNEETEET